MLRVKPSWLERRAAARKIPFTMLGGAYHFTAEHLAEIIRINEHLPTVVGEPKTSRHNTREQHVTGKVTTLHPRPRPEGPRRKRSVA